MSATWTRGMLTVDGQKVADIEIVNVGTPDNPKLENRFEWISPITMTASMKLNLRSSLARQLRRLTWRREKKRVGVHCKRFPLCVLGDGSDGRLTNAQIERWRRLGKRPLDRHDRWASMVAATQPGVFVIGDFASNRPDERALRFWGGKRRSIRRRHNKTSVPKRAHAEAMDKETASGFYMGDDLSVEEWRALNEIIENPPPVPQWLRDALID